MKGQQIELTDITPKEIQIKSLLSGWRTATREEARRFAADIYNQIMTSIDREAYINTRIRGTTYAELMKEEEK